MRWISRLTTIALVVVVIAGLALWIRSKMPNAQLGGQFETHAMFRDASRLQKGSPVVIAGVRVGDITKLSISGRFARVDMRLGEAIKLPAGTFATKRADSLFGDSYVELIPAGAGDQDTALLKDGEPIRRVVEGGSTDATLRAIARTLPKIDTALETIDGFMLESRRWVAGPLLERMHAIDDWLADGNIERPLATADRVLERFERGTTAAADAIADARPSVEQRIAGWDRSLVDVHGQIRDAKRSLVTALGDARAGFGRIDQTVTDMREVMSAIDEGRGDDWKGTLGRLVNDAELANTLEDFTGDAREGAAGLSRFRSWLGARGEVSVRTGDVRAYATAELNTRTDKFYLVEFSYSQQGNVPASDLTDATGSANFTRTQTIDDNFRFTAQFGKRFGFAQMRAGIKDSTPGLGVDALFGNGRLRLSADLFGSFERVPRLKVAGALAVFRSIYVLAGVDDALNAPGELPVIVGNTPVPDTFTRVRYGRDYFLGASLHFTDAELATILRFYGAVLTGFLVTR